MSNALRLEPYKAKQHYDIIAAWWKARDSEALPVDVLPDTGAVVTRDGDMLAYTACFLANAKFGFVAFTIAKPDLSMRETIEACALAVNGAISMAKLKGCKVIWSTTENQFLDRLYLHHTAFKRTTPHHNYYALLDPDLSIDMLDGEEPKDTKGKKP